MRQTVFEESVLFVSIIKWLFLASCVGVFVGLSTSVFLIILEKSSIFAAGFRYYFLLLPFALFASALIVKYLAPDAKGHGTEKVIEAVHRHSGKIKPLVVPVKLLATVITIALGGSAGKEGPCAQIGAGLSSIFAGFLRFDNNDRRKLVICGISAGFAAVFGTPIAGAIFGVEVLVVGSLLYDVLLPSFVAGVVSYQVSSALGITYFHEPLSFVPIFTGLVFIKVCISGLFFGLCSLILIQVLHHTERISEKIRMWGPYKGLLGGSILVILAFIFSNRYLGLGLETIKDALEGGPVFPAAFLLKIVFTSLTLSFGGSGGIVTPIFFVGATAGNIFGDIIGSDPAVFAAIGLVSVLAGAANTPISASIMAVELFGPSVGPYAAIACIISFLMTGHRSVYPSQMILTAKSSSIIVPKGKELGDFPEVSIKPRARSVTGGIIKGINRAKRGLRKDKKQKNEDKD
jgi:H+/Cl- antiporter ClcA